MFIWLDLYKFSVDNLIIKFSRILSEEQRYKIITDYRDIKIGVIGLIEEELIKLLP